MQREGRLLGLREPEDERRARADRARRDQRQQLAIRGDRAADGHVTLSCSQIHSFYTRTKGEVSDMERNKEGSRRDDRPGDTAGGGQTEGRVVFHLPQASPPSAAHTLAGSSAPDPSPLQVCPTEGPASPRHPFRPGNRPRQSAAAVRSQAGAANCLAVPPPGGPQG